MTVERPAVERRVIGSLESGRIPVLLGPCGTGRTSLLLRLARLVGRERSQYLDFGAVMTTPERCLAAVRAACPFMPASAADVTSPRAAFDALLRSLDDASGPDGSAVTFLIDEALDVRTFESFPGLRHVQRETATRIVASPNRFVLASRFTARTHRLLRDAAPRFEVIHLPPISVAEIAEAARSIGDHADQAPVVHALSAGRLTYARLLLDALSVAGPSTDPVASFAGLMLPGAPLMARVRESCELRLHRARGYSALKAILGILADASEPLTLTEIAHVLLRTPGSTKDYLSWLEDVDLVVVDRKHYRIEDPLVRVYLRLYGRAVPPDDAHVAREVRAYAESRLSVAPSETVAPEPVMASVARPGDAARSGIIEID